MSLLKFDPTYVQICETEAAEILGLTLEEFAKRRVFDKPCPKGFRDWTSFPPATRFRLADIYAYSERVMNQAQPESTELLVQHSEVQRNN